MEFSIFYLSLLSHISHEALTLLLHVPTHILLINIQSHNSSLTQTFLSHIFLFKDLCPSYVLPLPAALIFTHCYSLSWLIYLLVLSLSLFLKHAYKYSGDFVLHHSIDTIAFLLFDSNGYSAKEGNSCIWPCALHNK